jgi:hypothetical protein
MEWPNPKDVSDIRSFMGLEGYYISFIKGFPRLVVQSLPFRKRGLNSFGNQKALSESGLLLTFRSTRWSGWINLTLTFIPSP